MDKKVAAHLDKYLDKLRHFYDDVDPKLNWTALHYRKNLAHYYRLLIPESSSVLEVGCGGGHLLELLPNRDITGVDASAKQVELAQKRVPHGKFFHQSGEELNLDEKFDVIILSDTVDFAADVQAIFKSLKKVIHPGTRLILNFYNTLWKPAFQLGKSLGLKRSDPPCNWLSRDDLINLLDLADWQVVQTQTRILCPLPLFGLEKLLNRYLAPLMEPLCLATFCVARPRITNETATASVSVVIPARNEAGNIEAAIRRLPNMGKFTEVIFVEGNSTDNTWSEIQRVARENPEYRIKILQQSGKGKGNAVREGFDVAEGDILMILDADLTMPPEELPKFYHVLASGHAEFANGVRLVYPMEKEAMRFLNMCANKFFSIAFTWLLSQSVKDTLCGTKVLFRSDYDRIIANRSYFGDFDPFGDFDLLFGASKLNLKIADVPIRYRERTYGETNIHRWKHGLLLLRMTAFAARKLKFI